MVLYGQEVAQVVVCDESLIVSFGIDRVVGGD